MKVIHPHTKNTLLMVEGLELIAEIDNHYQTGPAIESDCDEMLTVTIGEIGYSQSIRIYRKDWIAFKQLVSEIDQWWAS